MPPLGCTRDFKARSDQRLDLRRIVGEEGYRRVPREDQEMGCCCEVASIDLQPQGGVRIDGVVADVLEGVRPDLVGDPDSSTLVSGCIDERSGASAGHPLERVGELLATVTPHRPEHIAGETARVDTDKSTRLGLGSTDGDGKVLVAATHASVCGAPRIDFLCSTWSGRRAEATNSRRWRWMTPRVVVEK
jgi:hypothetical protein